MVKWWQEFSAARLSINVIAVVTRSKQMKHHGYVRKTAEQSRKEAFYELLFYTAVIVVIVSVVMVTR